MNVSITPIYRCTELLGISITYVRGRDFLWVSMCAVLLNRSYLNTSSQSPQETLPQGQHNPHSVAKTSLDLKKSFPCVLHRSSQCHSHPLSPKNGPHRVATRAVCHLWSLCPDPSWELTTQPPWNLAPGTDGSVFHNPRERFFRPESSAVDLREGALLCLPPRHLQGAS